MQYSRKEWQKVYKICISKNECLVYLMIWRKNVKVSYQWLKSCRHHLIGKKMNYDDDWPLARTLVERSRALLMLKRIFFWIVGMGTWAQDLVEIKMHFIYVTMSIRNGRISKHTYGLPKLSSWLVISLIFHNFNIFNLHLTTHFGASFLRKRKTTYKVKTSHTSDYQSKFQN